MRDRFMEQLRSLNTGLIEMGEMCETVITMATDALINNNQEGAAGVAALDSDIDHKERAIESLCLKLLLQQQPVARDLRQISAALKMITDMERIGDQAADIAELVRYINGDAIVNSTKIGEMAKDVIYMVTESVNAYVQKDVSMAQSIIKYDDEVDRLFEELKREIMGIISSGSESAEMAVDLLMIAKYLERIGDHATNIAEWAVFSVTGVHKSDEMN